MIRHGSVCLRVIRDRISLRNLGLVVHAVLPEELHLDGPRFELLVIEEERVHGIAIAEDLLMVVRMGCALEQGEGVLVVVRQRWR